MKFKEGDKVIYSGYEAVVLKVLTNTNRYRIKYKYNGENGTIVDEEQIHKSLKDCYNSELAFRKSRLERLKIKYEEDKLFWENLIAETQDKLSKIEENEKS